MQTFMAAFGLLGTAKRGQYLEPGSDSVIIQQQPFDSSASGTGSYTLLSDDSSLLGNGACPNAPEIRRLGWATPVTSNAVPSEWSAGISEAHLSSTSVQGDLLNGGRMALGLQHFFEVSHPYTALHRLGD